MPWCRGGAVAVRPGMFDAEVRALLEQGFVLVGRIGYQGGFELKARAQGTIERLDHDAFLQLVVSRDVEELVARIEEPGRAARVVVLARDERGDGVVLTVGPLYLGGRLRVVETIDDPAEAARRWEASALPSCWVNTPTPGCC